MTYGTMIHKYRWAVLAAWAAAGAGLLVFVPDADPTANESESFLPAWAPSREGSAAFHKYFPTTSGLSDVVVVFERAAGPLTGKDLEAVERVAARAKVPSARRGNQADLEGVNVRSPHSLPLPPERNPMISPASKAGQAALVILNVPANFITARATRLADHMTDCIEEAKLPPGLSAAVTGSAGYGHDYLLAAKRSHDKTIKVTLAAVIVILLLVYRSPGAAMVPVLAVSAAVVMSLKVLALCTHVGLHVGTAELIFVVVLMYGAGVDYSLMLVSRYREALDDHLPLPRAAAVSLDATLPAILASAGTNTVGLFTLTFATHGIFRTSGPVIAIALTCALLAAMTLVPALLAAVGPGIFWPSRRMGQIGSRRLWPAVAKITIARPGLVLVATVLVLALPAVRGSTLTWVYDALTGLKNTYSARLGSEMAHRHWAVGEISPVRLLVESDKPLDVETWRTLSGRLTGLIDRNDFVDDARTLSRPLGRRLAGGNGLASAVVDAGIRLAAPREYVSADRRASRMDVILKHPGFSLEAMNSLASLRSQIKGLLPAGATLYAEGITAETADIRQITGDDFHLIAALVLSVIFLMVLALLRDVLLSLFMIASTLLSYLATLGLTYWIFVVVSGATGLDWKVQVFLFVVMVAVGQDYNIYLAARLAQEAVHLPPRQATARAVIRTGPVISSCGVIMAATLGSLAAGDIVLLTHLGTAMGLGMLIDTFIVRPLLLPAFVALTGRTGKAWGRTAK